MVFFDRGLIDAAAALEHVAGRSVFHTIREERYNQRVFFVPPWPEIYVNDSDRKHDFQEAVAEYERLLMAFASLGYDVVVLPKVGLAERVEIVLASLGVN